MSAADNQGNPLGCSRDRTGCGPRALAYCSRLKLPHGGEHMTRLADEASSSKASWRSGHIKLRSASRQVSKQRSWMSICGGASRQSQSWMSPARCLPANRYRPLITNLLAGAGFTLGEVPANDDVLCQLAGAGGAPAPLRCGQACAGRLAKQYWQQCTHPQLPSQRASAMLHLKQIFRPSGVDLASPEPAPRPAAFPFPRPRLLGLWYCCGTESGGR